MLHPNWGPRIIEIERWWRGDAVIPFDARHILVFPYGPIDRETASAGDIGHVAELLAAHLRSGATVIFMIPVEEEARWSGAWWARLETLASLTDPRVSLGIRRRPDGPGDHEVFPSTFEAYLRTAGRPRYFLTCSVVSPGDPEVRALSGFGIRAPAAVRWSVGVGEIAVVPLQSLATPTETLELLLDYDYRILIEESARRPEEPEANVRVWINGTWFAVRPNWADRMRSLYAAYRRGDRLRRVSADSLATIRRLRSFLEEKGIRVFPREGKYRNVALDPTKRIVLRDAVRDQSASDARRDHPRA